MHELKRSTMIRGLCPAFSTQLEESPVTDSESLIPSLRQHFQHWGAAREPAHPTKAWHRERCGLRVPSKIHQYTGWMVMSPYTTEGSMQNAAFIVPVPHSCPLRYAQRCKMLSSFSHLSLYLHDLVLLHVT